MTMKSAYETSLIIEEPSPEDILCGRGKSKFQHVGNEKLRLLIASCISRYKSAKTKKDKMDIVEMVAKSVTQNGGRFLVKDKDTGIWQDGGLKAGKKKCGHALRDAIRHRVKCIKAICPALQENDTSSASAEPPSAASKTSLVASLPVSSKPGAARSEDILTSMTEALRKTLMQKAQAEREQQQQEQQQQQRNNATIMDTASFYSNLLVNPTPIPTASLSSQQPVVEPMQNWMSQQSALFTSIFSEKTSKDLVDHLSDEERSIDDEDGSFSASSNEGDFDEQRNLTSLADVADEVIDLLGRH